MGALGTDCYFDDDDGDDKNDEGAVDDCDGDDDSGPGY